MAVVDKILKDYTSLNKEKFKNIVSRINELSDSMKSLKEADFIKKTAVFKERIKKGETKESIMIEAFALCREAIFRKLKMFPYDVQLEAAIAMQYGTVAEMKTGEGKTLVQILSAYLNALDGSSVHVVSSNDYLAGRDFSQNKVVFELLGLSTGLVINTSTKESKKEAYKKDIVYSTVKNIGFDYLRDNTCTNKEDQVITRDFGYIIVDEVDSILIDEATTPLILTKEDDRALTNEEKGFFKWATQVVESNNCNVIDRILASDDEKFYFNHNPNADILFNKHDTSVLFNPKFEEKVYNAIKKTYKLSDNEITAYYLRIMSIINYCVVAKYYYERGKQYKLDNINGTNEKEITLIDRSTGRPEKGKRFVKGIHEAIVAKENFLAQKSNEKYTVRMGNGSIVTGTCTYPDLLSMYKSGKCGMTGTSSEKEFEEIYNMPTYKVDTRKPNIRVDYEKVYLTKKEKYEAIINEIIKCNEIGRPVLVGTESVNESILLSKMLEERYILHNVLNADRIALESSIIATAGQFGSVTIATNMAGRGTDIKLGYGVRELGGLKVIGSSRNVAKRIDNQLKGRAARQGDPGETTYYSSLEDEMLVSDGRFNEIKKARFKDREKGKCPYGEALDIDISLVDKCQSTKEEKDKALRVGLIKYSEVLDSQRKEIYEFRNKILKSNNLIEEIIKIINKYIDDLTTNGNINNIKALLGHLVDTNKIRSAHDLSNTLINICKSKLNNNKVIESVRMTILKIVDEYWVSQIESLENNRVNLRMQTPDGKDPIEYYNIMATNSFKNMVDMIFNEIITYSLKPELKYGSYNIPQNIYDEDDKIIL